MLKEGRYLLKAAGDLESRVRRVASGWETEFTIGMDSALSPLGLHRTTSAPSTKWPTRPACAS
jgi:hypothetical protein